MSKSRKKAADTAEATAPDGAAPNGPGEVPTGFGDLEKVRNILFGSQSRDYERRFSRVEEQLERDLTTLQESLDRRLNALEAFMKEEVASLRKRLGTEQQQRTEGQEKLGSEVRDLIQAVKDQGAHLEEQLSETERGLRTKILDQSKDLTKEIRQQVDALRATLDGSTEELRDQKTDRLALADLFDGLAMRLRDEFTLPENGE